MGLNLVSLSELQFHDSRRDFRICPGNGASIFFVKKGPFVPAE